MSLQTKTFAITGRSVTGVAYTYTLRVTETGVTPQNNTSQLTVEAFLRQNADGVAFTQRPTGVSCTLVGSGSLFSDYAPRDLVGGGDHLYYTWTGDIPHNDDGTGKIIITGKLWQTQSDDGPPTLTLPMSSMALTPISRTARIQAADTAIGSLCTIAVITPLNDCVHVMSYRFGDLTGYLTPQGDTSVTPVPFVDKTLYWTIPESFYAQIPDQKWAQCHLTCELYVDGVLTGEPITTQFQVLASEGACGPQLSPQAQDINPTTLALTGDSQKLIRYHSTLRCAPGHTARHGATLVQTRVNGTELTGLYLDIPETPTGQLECYTRDSRGWESTATLSLPLIPYEHPAHRITVHRMGEGSTTVEVTVTGSFCPCDFGLAQNQLHLRYRLGSKGGVNIPITPDESGNYSVTFNIRDVDYTRATSLYLDATDLLETVTVRVTIQPGDPVFHWDAEQFTFCVPVLAQHSVSGLYIRPWAGEKWLRGQFSDWNATGSQSVLVLGSTAAGPVLGVIHFTGDGAVTYQGTGDFPVTAGNLGKLRLPTNLTQEDSLVFLSSLPISVE